MGGRRGRRAIRAPPEPVGGEAEKAVEAEGDGRIGHLVGRLALLEDEPAGQVVGDAEDGVGHQQRVGVADAALGDRLLDVPGDVGDGDVLAPADRRREPLLGRRELRTASKGGGARRSTASTPGCRARCGGPGRPRRRSPAAGGGAGRTGLRARISTNSSSLEEKYQ